MSQQILTLFGEEIQPEQINAVGKSRAVPKKNQKPVEKTEVAEKKAPQKKKKKAPAEIKPGDILTKVNDEDVDRNKDRNYYFTQPSRDRELKLTFNRNGQVVNIKIHPQATLFANLYDE